MTVTAWWPDLAQGSRNHAALRAFSSQEPRKGPEWCPEPSRGHRRPYARRAA